jgi:hypothetical protein
MAERVGWVRAAAGERFDRLELHALLQAVAVTRRRRSAAAERGKPHGLEAADVLASPHFLVGTHDEMIEDLVERRARWGISYWTLVGADALDALAPVVRRLSGEAP